ncbi:LysE family translocator [Halomarina rubra]|uniref:LysE family translocator n=1 Tax=Halomarina rubra TaxID=2071873 RepID=A0ABD6ARZ5_9EURY|nr:LysE family translocator [Halomarina rubra]
MSLVSTLLAGAVFGLALAAPPGPMNAVIAEQSVRNGWTAGFRAGLGAMTADLLFMVGALVGVVAVVQRYPAVHAAMVAVGGVLMLYFAYGAAKELDSGFRDGQSEATGFQRAFVLAITNPYQMVFWLTVGVGLLEPGTLDVLGTVAASQAGVLVVETGSSTLLFGFFGGILCWTVVFPATLVAAERRVQQFAPVVAGVSALVLAGFGVYFLYDAATTLGVVLAETVETLSS